MIRNFVETYFFFSCGLFLLSGIRTAWSSQPQPLSSMGQPLSIAVSLWAFFPFQRSFISLPLVARTGTCHISKKKYRGMQLRLYTTYSKVPNNSAARLLIYKIFFYQHGLIWTYTLIKIQIIFLPTRLLSTIF